MGGMRPAGRRLGASLPPHAVSACSPFSSCSSSPLHDAPCTPKHLHTYADFPGARLGLSAWGADTGEGANEVLAQHAPGMAVVLAIRTLIHICR